jgi:hypothetical protein
MAVVPPRLTPRAAHTSDPSGPEKLPHTCDGHRKANMLESREDVVNAPWWRAEIGSLALKDGEHHRRCRVDEFDHEVVRVLGFDPVWGERFTGKISEVRCHDGLGARTDGRGEDVSVVRIGKSELVDQFLIPFDEAVAYRGDHQVAGPQQLRFEVGAPAYDAAETFVEDGISPPSVDQTSAGKPDTQITQGRRM